jgi:hypothetical protein
MLASKAEVDEETARALLEKIMDKLDNLKKT